MARTSEYFMVYDFSVEGWLLLFVGGGGGGL